MDEQRLIISLEARVNKFERDFERAQKKANDNFTKMERRAKDSAKRTEDAWGKVGTNINSKLESAFSAFARGGTMALAAGGAVLAMKEIASSIAEVDREARKAGVSSQVWQQWSYVAKATGMTIDGVTDAMKELNIRGDEFAKTGKGSAEEAFKRLGYTAADVAVKLKDPSRFIDEIIGKLKTLDAAAQTRILDEIFGGTGAEQMAKTLGMSVSEIQKLRSEAATFTQEQIEAAQKIDREFATMWQNFTVYAKKAAVEGVNVASQIIGFINDPSQGARDRAAAEYNSPEKQLERLRDQRAKIAQELERVKADTTNFLQPQEVRTLEAALSAVDDQILELTGGSAEYQNALKALSAASNSLTRTFEQNATAATNFKSALAELKAFVPELKTELDNLATADGIEAAYQRAVGSARTMGEVMNATDLANRARSIVQFGNQTNMLDLIGAAEGTDRGRGYNETLGYGAFTGGAVNLTGMTLNEVLALQQRMLAHPDNTFNSSAVGRYQIVSTTLRDLMAEMKLSGDRLFDEATQDEMARALLRRRGNNPDALRNEWEGLRRVDDSTIRNAYTGTPTGAQKLDPTPDEKRRTDLLIQQAQARKNLNMSVEEGLRLAEFERSISGMSQQQQRIELEVYQVQAEARRQGITLTTQELSQIREKITLTAQLDQKNKETATAAQGLANAQNFFAQSFTSSLSGLLTGTTSLNDALRSLLNSLIDATLQAALLGQGPLSGLMGGGGGLLTGLFSLFGFSDGGYTGPGGKYQPAGVVHRGEYVMSKKATERLGVGNLESLHRSALKGYADGGLVGGPKLPAAPSVARAGDNTGPAININAPVTVNANGGTPEQNADLAKQTAREMEKTMRSVVVDEVLRQMRPGNTLSRYGRGR